MIRLETNLPEFFNELCEVIRLFWGIVEIRPDEGEITITHAHAEDGGQWIECFSSGDAVIRHAAPIVRGGLEEKRCLKRAVKTGCFLLMRSLTGMTPPWGSLTGIRPTRLMYELREQGITGADARTAMQERFFVSADKTQLLSDIMDMQRGLIDTPDHEYDLYLGIPFCTTRCSYCSFASGELGKGELVEPYIQALKREMALCASLMNDLGYKIRAAYMGGGTPTSLNAAQLASLLDEALRLFPGAREWTVEAGRPDTITRDKLRVLKERHIERISVNPQTFSDETLRVIGRAHTAQQTIEAYELARAEGIGHINMDLIAALPGETEEDFARSLEKTIALAPESITVHTLAIKRSSRLHEENRYHADADAAERMVSFARHRLGENGYRPYYLYRQKYMAGNLENVGYARAGYACLYNIDNMEETTRILALGAGAITKWLFPRERRIERAPNVRNIEQYIDRVDEMADRKKALIMS